MGFALTPSLYEVFKYPMKMKQFGLNETKLFHFMGNLTKMILNLQSEPL